MTFRAGKRCSEKAATARNAAAASQRITGLPHTGRRDCVVDRANRLLGFQDEGESKNWIEVAEEIPELGDGCSSRGLEEADGVEMLLDVAADDPDGGRGGVADSMAT